MTATEKILLHYASITAQCATIKATAKANRRKLADNANWIAKQA